MKVCVPDYFKKFKCIAGECKDNCCTTGWEIDIDDVSYDKYMSVDGKFGQKLKDGITISEDKSRCFKFSQNGRCVFLNDENLCEIIINLGEDKLCEICKSHPRFHNCFDDYRETGVGICCIEACQMILSNPHKTTFEIIEENEKNYGNDIDKDFLNYIIDLRSHIFEIIQNRDKNILDRIKEALLFTEASQALIDNDEYPSPEKIIPLDIKPEKADYIAFSNILKKLEPLDDEWTNCVNNLDFSETFIEKSKNNMLSNQVIYEQLFVYFLFRHFINAVFDGDILSRVKFSCFSCLLVSWLSQANQNDESIIENACLVSKEIEYSTENVDLLLDLSWTEKVLSTEVLLDLLK